MPKTNSLQVSVALTPLTWPLWLKCSLSAPLCCVCLFNAMHQPRYTEKWQLQYLLPGQTGIMYINPLVFFFFLVFLFIFYLLYLGWHMSTIQIICWMESGIFIQPRTDSWTNYILNVYVHSFFPVIFISLFYIVSGELNIARPLINLQ